MVRSYASSPPRSYILEKSSELLVDTYVAYLVLCRVVRRYPGYLFFLLGAKMLPPMTRPFKAQKSVKLLRSDLHQSSPVTSAFMMCTCCLLYCRFSSFKLTWRHNPLYVSYDFDSKNTRINFVLEMYKLENELNIFYCLDYFSNWSHLLSQLLERAVNVCFKY